MFIMLYIYSDKQNKIFRVVFNPYKKKLFIHFIEGNKSEEEDHNDEEQGKEALSNLTIFSKCEVKSNEYFRTSFDSEFPKKDFKELKEIKKEKKLKEKEKGEVDEVTPNTNKINNCLTTNDTTILKNNKIFLTKNILKVKEKRLNKLNTQNNPNNLNTANNNISNENYRFSERNLDFELDNPKKKLKFKEFGYLYFENPSRNKLSFPNINSNVKVSVISNDNSLINNNETNETNKNNENNEKTEKKEIKKSFFTSTLYLRKLQLNQK